MAHPFGWMSRRAQWNAFALTTLLTIAVMAGLSTSGAALQSPAAPYGIVSYEFAGDVPTAERMLDSWDTAAKAAAGFNLGLDYLYLFAYSSSIALGCTLVATAGRARWHALSLAGIALAWLQFVAAALDAVENYALLQMLFGHLDPIWPPIAWWCAAPKFGIVLLGIPYSLIGLAVIAARALLMRDQDPSG